MAYYFTVEEKKGKYLPLDIKKSKYFTKQSKFKNLGLSLQEIDLFTTMFNNEEELRASLLKEGILPLSMSSKSLSARLLRKDVYHKVIYDFLYQADIEYILDPNRLITRINDKLYEGDFRFVESLASAYLKFYDCASTAAEVRAWANFSIKTSSRSHYFDELDENGNLLLTRMLKLLIYEYYQNQDGKVTYKEGIKYLNLHSLIAFTNNYDKKNITNKLAPVASSVPSKEENIFMDATGIKEKKRKKRPIPGQIGFSEILK